MLDQLFHLGTEIGLWNGPKRNGIHLFSKCCIFCFLFVFVLQCINLVLSRNNLEMLFECSSIISFCGMGVLKLYSLHFKGSTWLGIFKQMEELEALKSQKKSVYEYDSDDEEDSTLEYNKLKQEYEKKFQTISKILRIMYRFTMMFYMTSPFLEYGFWYMMGHVPSKYPHVYPVWAPLDDVHIFWYILMVFFEIVALAYCNGVTISFDVTFIGIIILICGQYNILIEKCTRIGGRGSNSVCSRKRDKRAHSRICYSHKAYTILVKAITKLDGLFRNGFGFYFLISTLTLCCCAVRLKLMSLSILQITRVLQYASAILFQLFLCCTYGDDILNASSLNVGEGPFCAAIWCLSPYITREIVLLSVSMSQERRVAAGPFNIVNLPSFVQITRAAYSCYAVVGQMKK